MSRTHLCPFFLFESIQAIPTCRYRPCLRSWPKRATMLPDNRRRSRTFSPRLWTCRRKQSWYENITCATLTEIPLEYINASMPGLQTVVFHIIFIKIHIVCCWERGADAALGCSQRRPEATHCRGEKTVNLLTVTSSLIPRLAASRC